MSNGGVYRRGSVFGGLLLIGVGALFLYANIHPEFTPWPLIATYWPVLLIFWGLSRLVDYLVLRGTPEAAAVTRLGAGDIIGLIFLLIIGSAFSQMVHRGWWKGGPIVIGDEEIGCLFGSEFDFSDELDQAVTATGTFTLENPRGDIALAPGADNHIRLLARKRICASSEAEAQNLARKILPVLEPVGDGYEFRWDTPSGSTGLWRANLEVHVPKAMSVKLSSRRGDVTVSELEGGVALNLERGDATVGKIGGGVSVEIRRGSVRVSDVRGGVTVSGRGDEVTISNTGGDASVEGEYYGPIRMSAIGGAGHFVSRRTTFTAARIDGVMTIDSGDFSLRGVPGDVTLFTRDKEIDVDAVGGQIRIANRNGRVVIRAAKPPTNPIEVENERGSIEVILPGASGFQLSATARKGDINSDFAGLSSERAREHGPDETLTGTVGDGRASIHLTTSYGTISIRRSG